MKLFNREKQPFPHEELALARRSQTSLEAVLMELQQHGQPRIGIYSSAGWHCSVELSVSTVGFQAKVGSGFDHAVPIDAALECRERLMAALRQAGQL